MYKKYLKQILGIWEIQATDLYKVKSGHEMKCGHFEPDDEKTSYKAQSQYDFVYFIFLEKIKKN